MENPAYLLDKYFKVWYFIYEQYFFVIGGLFKMQKLLFKKEVFDG